MITEEIKEDLRALEVDDNIVRLPKEQLNDYAGLKKLLIKATGKYKRNTFEFPMPAGPIISTLLNGKIIDFKKEFQFFATPENVAEEMMNEVLGYPDRILEPSAGHGALIDALLNIRPNSTVHALELSELNYEVLRDKYDYFNQVKVAQGDFLELTDKHEYDLIIANPPFSKNQDIDHVYKMYDLLAPGGRIITIMSTSWTFGQQHKQKQFREWIEEVGATVRSNENGAFKSSGTMVNSVMVTIDK